jgi:hypothetical protein
LIAGINQKNSIILGFSPSVGMAGFLRELNNIEIDTIRGKLWHSMKNEY